MERRILGRTGLEVSVIGLGAGGPSRLGRRDDAKSEAESVRLVQMALDAGVNFIDTAEGYGTEVIVGKAIAGRTRDELVISTKKGLGGERITKADLRAGLENSLRRLGTDFVDVYHLHGLRLEQYDYYAREIAPEMMKLRDEGKLRFIGVTESWNRDLRHAMLERALEDDIWDVFMVGFNLLNQTARDFVLRKTLEKNIGVLVMMAVRRALSRPEKLRATLHQLIEAGEIAADDIDLRDPLGFLRHDDGARGIPDAAYRFCRDEPGVHVVLSGTGSPAHLKDNIRSFAGPPLAAEHSARLKAIFADAFSVTGE